MDRSLIKPDRDDSQNHPNVVGPIESVSGTQNTHQQTFPHHQILPSRSTTSNAYKKTLQSSTITISNPNRYSYMMAVNTHPVAMKEHRL